MGALVRRRKDNPTMFYGHIDHPVNTRADWEAYKLRFQASTNGKEGGIPFLLNQRFRRGLMSHYE